METAEQYLIDLEQLLNEYAEKFTALYTSTLSSNNHKATGNLIDSVHTVVNKGDSKYDVVVNLKGYYYYVEKGRKSGKRPPYKAILDWIKVKRIVPIPRENKKPPTQEQLAFLIQRAIGDNGTIKKYGYKGSNIMINSIDELNATYVPLITQEIEKITNHIEIQTLNDIDKLIRIY